MNYQGVLYNFKNIIFKLNMVILEVSAIMDLIIYLKNFYFFQSVIPFMPVCFTSLYICTSACLRIYPSMVYYSTHFQNICETTQNNYFSQELSAAVGSSVRHSPDWKP